MRSFLFCLLTLSTFSVHASVDSRSSAGGTCIAPSQIAPEVATPHTPPQYVMMSCLEGADKIEQGYLVGDDGTTKIDVLRLTNAPEHCRTNMLSHPFVIELMRAGTMKESIWFNSQSVDAVLKGDGWKQRDNPLAVSKGDVVVHRTYQQVDSVGLITDVVDSGSVDSVWIMFEFKTEGSKEKIGSILVERDNLDGFEIWSPKPNQK